MNIYYKLYIEQILKLVSSLIVKSEYAVRQMNEWSRLTGIDVDMGLPKTWKYYMNLNGDYHQSDEQMFITSQDTFEEIPFTKETLDEHLVTKITYKEMGRFYKALVEKYPSQELLIKGILNPIHYDTSIDAQDHKILGYNSSLIEPQEQFLIPEIQEYIYGVYDRYFNEDYTRIEATYNAYVDAVIFANLPSQIILSRKRRMYTDLAHSYHIRMYLLSFCKNVGDEFNYLSRYQKVWLYRNIKFLTLNIGTNETLESVVKNIMNERGFPVVATEVEFDYSDMLNDLNPTIKTNGIKIANIDGRSLIVDGIDDILLRQIPKAPLNSEYRHYDRERFELKYNRSRFDGITTKVLESNIIDRTDAEPFTFTAVLLNYWIFLAYQGMYKAKISITVPSTGQVHQLDMLEAFVLYVYSMSAREEVYLDEIPCLYAQRVLRLTPPSVNEIESLRMNFTPRYFTEYVRSKIIPPASVVSVISFNEMARNIHSVQNDLRDMRHLQGDYKVEGNLHQIIDRFYHSMELKPYNGKDYHSWFAERDIDVELWSTADHVEIVSDLFEKSTGTSMNRGSDTKDLHAAMIRILEELTSYSVHLLSHVNGDGVKILDTKFPKQTIPKSIENNKIYADINNPYILETKTLVRQKIAPIIKDASIREIRSTTDIILDIPANLSAAVDSTYRSNLSMYLEIPLISTKDKEVWDVDVDVNFGYSNIDYSETRRHVSLHSTKYSGMTVNRFESFIKS